MGNRFVVVRVSKYLDGPAHIRAILAWAVADRNQANHTVSPKFDNYDHAQAYASQLEAEPSKAEE